MQPSDRCTTIIKAWEGIRDGDPTTVNLDAYLCPSGYVTIGWGHVVVVGGEMLRGHEGLRIAKQVYPDGITMEQAEALLRADIESKAVDVESLLKVEVSQGEFDALVSFAFNVGNKAFCDSTLARKANAGDMPGACAELSRWTRAGGRELPGLVKRRAAERELCERGLQ